MKEVIAILASDLHLSLKAPVARSAEIDWLQAMQRPLDELKEISKDHDAPVIVAGDLFDKWNSPPELINFALEHMPKKFYGIPGQHDLPNHRIDEVKRSAYWTLIKAGILYDLGKWEFFLSDHLAITGFPWNAEITPHDSDRQPENDRVQLAVIHHYLYSKKSNSYYGVSKENHALKFQDKLKGFDAAVFGDNHISFSTKIGDCNVFNAGTFLRRKSDEYNYKPQVGLLHEDGTITPHYLDTSKDKFIDIEEAKEKETQEIDTAAFLDELKSLGADSLDFRDAANKYMDGREVDSDVRKLVLESME